MVQEKPKTKIVVTMGPSCVEKKVLKELFLAGVDVCRLNFSHGTHEEHSQAIKNILDLNKQLGLNVGILGDLQGPKIRIGKIENDGVTLKNGDILTIKTCEEFIGTSQAVYINYKNFPKDVTVGGSIIIDDGKIMLKVIETNQSTEVKAEVVYGGVLSSKKGVNLPDTKISLPSLTEKDMKDVKFAIENGLDWIALSFVRSSSDIKGLREILKANSSSMGIIAKIEKPEALEDIDNIINETDAIMIARGDLGVEVSFSKVPLIQKSIIEKCISKAKPVIVATQLMESMMSNFRPTRAEATDVANAVIHGGDALMLSGETSIGKFPVDAVKSMRDIIDWTEKHGFVHDRFYELDAKSPKFISDAICSSACQMSGAANAKAIVTFTNSGYTAARVCSHRPKSEIFAFTNSRHLIRKLSLFWGIRAYPCKVYSNVDYAIDWTVDFLKDNKIVSSGDTLIHIGSTPLQLKGRANMIKVAYVDKDYVT